ncbi:galactose-specific lectin nattectin-like [Seriola dumerili]|uniref:Galactose-specific lectin nattectin-like n=1 Tax=Seriola dumerili TaxID=41447 RepID=A0A3B4V3C2_SERDU|nr:galactose-specific lectin nattectin-like [Seriola dumerili]
MASHFLLCLCLASGLLAAASGCGEEKNVASGCPSGWTQFGSRCFIFYWNSKTWLDAETYCISIGGNLASVHSADEHFFLRNMIYRVSGRYRLTWIGGFDAVEDGVWMWSDGSKFDYTRWATNEPDVSNTAQHCVEMNRNKNYWGDDSCTSRNPFICSKNI